MADADSLENDDPSQSAGDGGFATCTLDNNEEKEMDKGVSEYDDVLYYGVGADGYIQPRHSSDKEYDYEGGEEMDDTNRQQNLTSGLYGLMADNDDGYCFGEIFSYCPRPSACRKLVETLVPLTEKQDDVLEVFDVVERVSQNPNPCLSEELIEHVPHFALVMARYYHGKPDQQCFIAQRIIPLLVKFLMATDVKHFLVRRSSHWVLRMMRQQNLIDHEVVNKEICPVIVKLTFSVEPSSEFFIRPLSVMTLMVPILGKEATEEFFVPRLVSLCSVPVENVRKFCAENFGMYCAAVSPHVMDNVLLPCFMKLCRDESWEVRKACAEVIMSVSCACRLEERKSTLAPAGVELLVDQERMVRMSAIESLGPFITTFAKPSITSLGYNKKGRLVLTNNNGFEFSFDTQDLVSQTDPADLDHLLYEYDRGEGRDDMAWRYGQEGEYLKREGSVNTESEEDEEEALPQEFDTFLYWRDPLPELDNLTLLKLTDKKKESWWEGWEWDSPEQSSSECLHLPKVNRNRLPSPGRNKHNVDYDFLLVSGFFLWMKAPEKPRQDIVPQALIDHFVSLEDPIPDSNTIHRSFIAYHIAFSLPAVALTLGKDNWVLLKGLLATLAANTGWKVRRVIASSIHELALIIGEDAATQDLVPIYNKIIKDVDSVRIGALKHLAQFLKRLKPAGRNTFLPKLADFLMTDYEMNWRFREELVNQLLQIVGLFSPPDTYTHLMPLAVALLSDKVAAVRNVALSLVTELLRYISYKDCDPHRVLLHSVLVDLADRFANAHRWTFRQTFALLSSQILKENILSDELFATNVLPHLIDLSWDVVPNVRLAVARTLASDIETRWNFRDPQSRYHELVIEALRRLQEDDDRDVRYFAMYTPDRSTTTLSHNGSIEDVPT